MGPSQQAISPAPSITFDQVSLQFENVDLLENFSLQIKGGQCTCILGPSGCGKSTLLRLISGAIPFDYTGNITIHASAESLKKTAWMSQDDLLLPWMTLLDNILLGAKLRNSLTQEKKTEAKKLIREAGLDGYATALPAALSGGMRQRTALLRTLMENRQILLMDEPFSALDALTRFTLQNLTARLTDRATVILVTHDPLEALRLGDNIVVLSRQPTQVLHTLTPTGFPPRDIDDPAVAKQYASLMNELMNSSGA